MKELRMKGLGLGLIVACVAVGQALGAESAADAIKAFGLIGSWSLDCSKAPTATCEPKTGCGSRITYEVPPVPMIRNVVGTTVPGVARSFDTIIESAIRIGDDKLKITTVQVGVPGDLSKFSWVRQPGERWEGVFVKAGNKYRALSAQREDGKKIFARDGLVYAPPPNTKYDEIPADWIRTDKETLAFERCPN